MARKLKKSLSNYQAAKRNLDLSERKNNHAKMMKTRQKEAQAARSRAAAVKVEWLPFDDYENVILIGEGDFSFAQALATKCPTVSILATSLDSYDECITKYPLSKDIIQNLKDENIEVSHEIDATKLSTYRQLKAIEDPKIVFNFPHLGKSISDQERNIIQHQKLLLEFFEQCKNLNVGSIIMSFFNGQPYDSWEYKRLARSQGYKVARSSELNWESWPGYTHQLTTKNNAHTSKDQKTRGARMILFQINTENQSEGDNSSEKPAQTKRKKRHGNDDDDDEDDEF
ncbi:25S rRNA (uracil2634-N3)-methyltransferase [Starmerella bacillaris]|uniref:25S rRNA (Uracil2634-N3)-methyltransferase n=1 Tax=Starmerella bacillaris TaxID=1247836 RepID=A0AAV5RH39_STABA|nr:25S rRNA (uracil2634-N3)-methyltransferase [Starmerella bacillaris]